MFESNIRLSWLDMCFWVLSCNIRSISEPVEFGGAKLGWLQTCHLYFMHGSSSTYIPHGCNNTIIIIEQTEAVHHCPHDTLVSLSIIPPWFGRLSQHLQRIIITLQLSRGSRYLSARSSNRNRERTTRKDKDDRGAPTDSDTADDSTAETRQRRFRMAKLQRLSETGLDDPGGDGAEMA
jgi:hypothetical protein